jgi:phytoene dehydrogenase-like protein
MTSGVFGTRIVAGLAALFNVLALNLAMTLAALPLVTAPVAVTATSAALDMILPGIDDYIVVKLGASAMTSYRFTGNYQGAMLGWEMSPAHLGSGRLPHYTPVENVYLTGHWTQPGGGITPVIVSAQRVAKTVLTGKDHGRELAAQYFSFRGANAASIAQAVGS